MNILIVGGNGFIGSHLIDELMNRGHQIRVFDMSYERFRQPFPNVDYRITSLDNTSELYEALLGIDIIFYLASASVPSSSNIDTVTDVNKNLIPLLNLLNLSIKLNIRRIVYFSSGGAVYGNPHIIPIPEEHATNPVSSYGILKLTIEKYLMLYQRIYGLNPLIIRPSNPFGPRQGHYNAQGVISTFLVKIKNNEPITIFGDGNSPKDYIYITDFIHDCVDLAVKNETGIFNIGNGNGTTVNEIVSMIKTITQKDPEIIKTEKQKYDVEQFILDNTKQQSILGEKKRMSIYDGIKETWHWINNYYNN
ncbi:NAD-dependent dehydratase [Bacteroidia bacterium]|nr:NAD-dependent dehydratase [Bacteroidia bacterium]